MLEYNGAVVPIFSNKGYHPQHFRPAYELNVRAKQVVVPAL